MDNLIIVLCVFVLPAIVAVSLLVDFVVDWNSTRKDMKYLEEHGVVVQPEEYVRERGRRRET